MRQLALFTAAALTLALACDAPSRDRVASLPPLPSTLAQDVVEGVDPAQQSFALGSAAASTCAMTWSMLTMTADGRPWLEASGPLGETSGILSVGSTVQINVRMKVAAPVNLLPGTYSGAIVFEGRCVENNYPAAGSPAAVTVNLRVTDKPGTLTIRWRMGGQPAATACPAGGLAAIYLSGVDAPIEVPCTAGQTTIADAPLGVQAVTVALRSSLITGTTELDVLDAPYRLMPAATATVELDFLASGAETDDTVRPRNSMACFPGAPNLLGNGGFEQVPNFDGTTGTLPDFWETVRGAPKTFDEDGLYGFLPSTESYDTFIGVHALEGRRFVAARPFNEGLTLWQHESFAHPLRAQLVAGNHYRLRAFLHPATSALLAGSAGYAAWLTNADRSEVLYLGRLQPSAEPRWDGRSFSFRAPAQAAIYSKLELAPFSAWQGASSYPAIDGVALNDVTACAYASGALAWTVGGFPAAQACPPGSLLRARFLTTTIEGTTTQSATYPCSEGAALVGGIVPGASSTVVDLLAADGTTLLDRQELIVDLRAPNHVPASLASFDLLGVARDPDGAPAVATTPACEGAPELLRNGGFEESPAAYVEPEQMLPRDWGHAGGVALATWTLFSIDSLFGYWPGSFYGDFYRGAVPAQGARFLSTDAMFAFFGQALGAPLVAGRSYRVRAMLRSAHESYNLDRGGVSVFLTNADATQGRFLARLREPSGDAAQTRRWQMRSATFVAPANAASLTHFSLRGSNMKSTDGTDLSVNFQSSVGLDALSLTDVTACAASIGARVRVTWSIGSAPGASGCQAGDVVKLSVEGAPRIAVPCERGLHELPAGATLRPHVYAELVRGGAVVAALEWEVGVVAGGVGRMHLPFLRVVDDGTPCAVSTRACFGKPVSLIRNGSFEASTAGVDHDADPLADPPEWGTYPFSGVALNSIDQNMSPASEGFSFNNGGILQSQPADGVRYLAIIGTNSITPITGEGGDDRIYQQVPTLVSGRRYRIRAFVRRQSPAASFAGRGHSLRIRFGRDANAIPTIEEQNIRVTAARTCPVGGNGWEERSVTFTAPSDGPYLFFDPFSDDTQNYYVLLDSISMTDVTDCGV